MSAFNDKPWQWYIERAEHYLAIEQPEIYLYGNDDKPWAFVSDYGHGSGFRIGMAVTGDFTAKHPCGISFRWHFDLEDKDANGTSGYKPNLPEIMRTMARLPEPVAAQFRAHLHEMAAGLRAQADKSIAYARSMNGAAAMLDSGAA